MVRTNMSSNGNALKLGGVVTLIVGVLYFIGNSIIRNDEKRICEDQRIEARFNDLRETANDCLHKIDKRLSRIEDRLGIEVKDD